MTDWHTSWRHEHKQQRSLFPNQQDNAGWSGDIWTLTGQTLSNTPDIPHVSLFIYPFIPHSTLKKINKNAHLQNHFYSVWSYKKTLLKYLFCLMFLIYSSTWARRAAQMIWSWENLFSAFTHSDKDSWWEVGLCNCSQSSGVSAHMSFMFYSVQWALQGQINRPHNQNINNHQNPSAKNPQQLPTYRNQWN